MKQPFLSYQLSKLLNEREDFNVSCFAIRYPDNVLYICGFDLITVMLRRDDSAIPAPTYDQVVDWFYEKYGMLISADLGLNPINFYPMVKSIVGKGWHTFEHEPSKWSDSRYEALDNAIRHALTLIPE